MKEDHESRLAVLETYQLQASKERQEMKELIQELIKVQNEMKAAVLTVKVTFKTLLFIGSSALAIAGLMITVWEKFFK